MDAGVIAYSAQKNLFERLEVVANNVANVATAGFKGDLSIYMQPTGKVNGEPNPIPTLKSATDLTQASLKTTGRQLDVAIEGNGFFQVQTPLGPRYTRNGTFLTNSEGTLVTSEGYPVIGDGGSITLDPKDYHIKIGEDGTILADNGETQDVRGTIGVFKFNDNSKLEKVGNTYFKSSDTPETATVKTNYRIAQGMVEESNVNSVTEMTQMLDISRSVQGLSKIIQDQHSLLRSAVQRITAKAS